MSNLDTMEEEFNTDVKTIKSRKAASLDEILPEVWKTKKFDDILQLCNAVYKQNIIREMNKRLKLPFLQEE